MSIIFILLILVILYSYVFFPIIVQLMAVFYRKELNLEDGVFLPRVSLIIIVRNGGQYIDDKIKNCLSLEYPSDRYEVVVVSDGSTDNTASIVRSYSDSGDVIFFDRKSHEGKNSAINFALDQCHHELLVLTDVSAILAHDALNQIVSWFQDPKVGGVCGRKLFRSGCGDLVDSQKTYLSYEDNIRKAESKIASIASNEGFFYGIRKNLVRFLPEGVTDDLYSALSVIRRNHRFLFNWEAYAYLPLRAKTPQEEIMRRRRIVCGSLRGIIKSREVLNPFRFPLYSWILFSHKVVRRLIPVVMMLLFVVNIALVVINQNQIYIGTVLLQIVGYLLFLLIHFQNGRVAFFPSPLRSLCKAWYYFCLGNVGTLLGVIDLIKGANYSKWDPVKGHG